MRAIVMRSFGDADVLEYDEVADPAPQALEALVRVGAVAVSRTRDVATRTGRHPFSQQVSLPHVLGGDFAGTVEATGENVDPALVGQRVAATCSQTCGVCVQCRSGREAQCSSLEMLGIHRWGSYAELVAVPAASLHAIPDDVSMAQGAALAANGPIAYTQLELGKVSAGTWVMVTGATGALGTMLAALAHDRGARVIGVSRRPFAIPREMPLDGRCDSRDEDLAASLLALTGTAGVATAIDNVAAGEVFARYFPALAIGGRVVISGAIGAAELPVLQVPAAPFYLRSLSLLGVRTATPRDVAAFWEHVGVGFRLPESLVRAFPLDAAAVAHTHVASGDGIGHVVLTVRA